MLTAQNLKSIMPRLSLARATALLPFLIAAMREQGINSRLRACAFLAQLAHESVDLTRFKEIGGASYFFKMYDKDSPEFRGRRRARKLGNTQPGDGARFCGRGGIQRTGRKNYRRAQEALGLPVLDHPELLELPENSFRSDALYFADNAINRLSDRLTGKGDTADLRQFDKTTKAVNGGYNGQVERQAKYLRALKVLTDKQFAAQSDGQISGQETEQVTAQAVAPSITPNAPEMSAPATIATNNGASENNSLSPSGGYGVLDEFPVNATTKTFAAKGAARVGLILARPLAFLYAAIEAGNVAVIAGVVVAFIAVFVLAYLHRADLERFLRYVLKRLGAN